MPIDADAELEPARRPAADDDCVRDEPWQQQAAEAHAAHERAEQDAERDRRRPDHELQQLEPDDFVDRARRSRCRRTAAAAQADTGARVIKTPFEKWIR